MATAVASVPARRARDASGVLTTAVQMSYAVGLTVLGSYFLGHAAPGDADRSGHAFTSLTYILAGLSVGAAALAGARAWSAVVGWRRSRLGARPLSEGAGRSELSACGRALGRRAAAYPCVFVAAPGPAKHRHRGEGHRDEQCCARQRRQLEPVDERIRGSR